MSKQCNVCAGSGRCPQCAGTGSDSEREDLTCAYCDGEGSCSECEGSGNSPALRIAWLDWYDDLSAEQKNYAIFAFVGILAFTVVFWRFALPLVAVALAVTLFLYLSRPKDSL